MFNLKRAFYGVVLVFVTITGCEKEALQPNVVPSIRLNVEKQAPPPDLIPINFCGLAVGQQARYIRFKGYQYASPGNHDNYEYFEDTLVVKIVEETENGFLLEEYYTPGSPINEEPDSWEVLWPDSTLQYYLRLSNDTIRISGLDGSFYYSRLFFEREGLPLGLFEGDAEIIGWKTSFAYSESYMDATVAEWDLFGQSYINLRLLIDNTFMQVDGPGFTFVYHPSDGLVRSVTYSWWTQEGVGHDKLPD